MVVSGRLGSISLINALPLIDFSTERRTHLLCVCALMCAHSSPSAPECAQAAQVRPSTPKPPECAQVRPSCPEFSGREDAHGRLGGAQKKSLGGVRPSVAHARARNTSRCTTKRGVCDPQS